MSSFLKIPPVTWVGGKYPWRLDGDLVFKSDKIGLIIVPRGYLTDFASVPRLPIIRWAAGGRASMPAIVHDYLYDCCTKHITRAEADASFLDAMTAIDDPSWAVTRRIMWLGVRAGGWAAWRKDSTDKCVGC
ncbi:MAG: DUF1353 domain-containing protein [Porticoccus sp.]|uniref:DUF1353 domain-containing protein n=1 Tax=Porticoccus sp. TaxID=2024853 RepID=UPI0032997545